MPQTELSRWPLVGGKAEGLLRIQAAGLSTPDFDVSPPDLAAAAARLGWPLAVRSSASLEDGQRDSFAGQFESFLNINSIGQLKRAVQQCRESVNSAELASYCQQRHIDTAKLHLHVIVQRMIQPELAGVAFSVNPVTGANEVFIEAVEGLADKLLAGAQSPLPPGHRLVRKWLPQIEAVVGKLQAWFGQPQDVEFAIQDGKLWVLQTRPITRISFSPGEGHWTNADFRDGGVSSTVCSPLMSSLYRWIWDCSLKSSLREIRLFRGDFEASRNFFARPYWNLGEVKRCMQSVPGYVEREFDRDLGVRAAYQGDGQRTPTTLRTVLRALPTVWGIRQFFSRQKATGERLLSGEWNAIRRLYEGRKFSDELLDTLFKRDYFFIESQYFRTVFAVSLAKLDFTMSFPHLDYQSLVSGLAELSHMAPQRRIEEMRERGEVDVEALMKEFRHHCRWGVDVIHPRWDEDPEFVASLVEQTPAATSRVEAHETARTLHESARREALSDLSRGRRRSFSSKLRRLRQFVWLREELRNISNEMYHLLRRGVKEIAEQRFLGDDIFFMTWQQIRSDDRAEIDRQRSEYEGYRHFKAPNEVGLPQLQGEKYDEANGLQDSWKGIGASHGRLTGKAQVAHTVEQAMQVEPGAILICPFTEPGWTPALARVGAVVTETGGLLSHAAVICREFGVPAVLAVEHATSIIPDGARLAVDGSTGRIKRAV